MKKYCLTAVILGSGLALAGTALAGADCDKSGKGALERFNGIDTNKDGKVTLAELTQSKEGWLTRVDANKDGVATPAEIEQSHKAMHAERIQRMFERKDANKDGRLTLEESQMPEQRFSRSDTNKDRALTPAELGERSGAGKHEAGGKPRGHRGGKLAGLDQNKDGKVERVEVQKAAARMLERLDANADGSLTSEELGRHGGRGHGKGRHGEGGEGAEGKSTNVKPITS